MNPDMNPMRYACLSGILVPFLGPVAQAATPIDFSFTPGNVHGWTRTEIPSGTSGDFSFFAVNNTFGNRITWNDPAGGAGGLVVTNAANADARGSLHKTAVLTSPSFTLSGTNPAAGFPGTTFSNISFKLLAGKGNPTSPASLSSLPADSVDNGAGAVNAYLGVGLRRESDGTYLLWGRRTSDAQNNNWQTVTLDQAALATATAADAPGTLYRLDVVDAAHGNWGWMAMDSLSVVSESEITQVFVDAQDSIGAESGSDQTLTLRFSRTGVTTEALPVSYTVGGTAVEGTDYTELPGSQDPVRTVTIPAGQASVDVPIQVLANELAEVDRSVQLTIGTSEGYLIGSRNSAQVWISDLPQTGNATISGPLPTGSYIPFPNPLLAGTAGSLFFYGEANYDTGYLSLGIRPGPSDNTANGGVDVGRNNALAPNAIFDYLDNKNQASATARVGGGAEMPFTTGGRYTLLGEIQFLTANSGTLRAWIWNGTSGSLDYSQPNVETTFTNGFTNMGPLLYLRLDGNSPVTKWTNSRALWVEGADPAQLQAALAGLTPSRPFIYVDPVATNVGEFANRDAAFRVFRSGPPAAEATIPLTAAGSAEAADFNGTLPVSVVIPEGESTAPISLEVVADTLYEGNESLSFDTESTYTRLRGISPAMTILDRPFQAWMAGNFPGMQEQGPEDDSDMDGQENLLEYFAGTLPGSATSLIHATAGANPGSMLYQRNPAATDLSAKVLWSADLEHWFSSGESDGQRTVSITEQVVSAPESQYQTVSVSAQVDGSSASRLFLRVAVELAD